MKVICNVADKCKYGHNGIHCFEHDEIGTCKNSCLSGGKLGKKSRCVPVFIELVKKTIKGAEWTKY
jgi:hypothetical protein